MLLLTSQELQLQMADINQENVIEGYIILRGMLRISRRIAFVERRLGTPGETPPSLSGTSPFLPASYANCSTIYPCL